jgi:signal transduction histidine kinase/CheY-like chemotaxis protein
MNPYSFIPFSSFLINIVLAAVVLALNPWSRTNRAYGLFACCFALWAFMNFLEWNFETPGALRVFAHLEPLCWLPSTLLVLNFIYRLVKRHRGWIFWSFTAIVLAWSAIGAATCCLLSGFRHTYWGEFALVTNLYLPAVLMAVFLPAAWGFYILFKTFKNASDRNFRTQLKYLTIGTLVMFMLVVAESVFRTSLLKIDSLPFFGSFFLIIQSVFVFFAIIRHRFLNVDVRDAARDIFSQVHEGVLILDPNQGISDMNASAREFFGMAKEQKSTDLERLFGKEYRFDENCENREITYSDNDKVKTGLLSQSDLFDGARPIGKLVVVHDITRQREEERKRVLLECAVQQSHASRLEALGMLAGGIAHDFNNMLSGVIGFATLLRLDKPGLNEKLLSYTDNIIKVARQAADLTKKLLAFSRRNASEMAFFNLHETIMDIVSLLEHTIDKRISIMPDLAAKNATLNGDRAQIQNMLLNMAINSRDAMPDGGELRFKTRNEELTDAYAKAFNKEAEGGVYIVVDVEDTGIGMTEEVKKKIFDPFFTTKQPGKGTGLGLASAYGVASSHKGFISVDTEIGKGTVFHAYFPAAIGSPFAGPEKKPEVEHGKGNILLVDDEESVRVSTARMLDALGYTATTCCNGEDAVKWYREHEDGADLVLLDVMMPGMSGDRCAELLLKINPAVKIMFISGYPGTLSPEKLEALSRTGGPIKMVQKPFTLEHLSRMVKETMTRGPA